MVMTGLKPKTSDKQKHDQILAYLECLINPITLIFLVYRYIIYSLGSCCNVTRLVRRLGPEKHLSLGDDVLHKRADSTKDCHKCYVSTPVQ